MDSSNDINSQIKEVVKDFLGEILVRESLAVVQLAMQGIKHCLEDITIDEIVKKYFESGVEVYKLLNIDNHEFYLCKSKRDKENFAWISYVCKDGTINWMSPIILKFLYSILIGDKGAIKKMGKFFKKIGTIFISEGYLENGATITNIQINTIYEIFSIDIIDDPNNDKTEVVLHHFNKKIHSFFTTNIIRLYCKIGEVLKGESQPIAKYSAEEVKELLKQILEEQRKLAQKENR